MEWHRPILSEKLRAIAFDFGAIFYEQALILGKVLAGEDTEALRPFSYCIVFNRYRVLSQ